MFSLYRSLSQSEFFRRIRMPDNTQPMAAGHADPVEARNVPDNTFCVHSLFLLMASFPVLHSYPKKSS